MIYLFIYLIFRKRRKVFPVGDETSQKDEEQIRRLNSEKELAFTAFLILLALVITQIPYLVVTVIEANCQSCTETLWVFVCHKFADFLLCLSAIANPYLYGCRVKQPRDSFRSGNFTKYKRNKKSKIKKKIRILILMIIIAEVLVFLFLKTLQLKFLIFV